MREIRHSALVAQPPGRLYTLINDIENYPRFIPWCTHASVQSRSEREIVATIGIKRGALQSEFTTRNELEPDRRIVMRLVSGPFRHLEGEWLLVPIPPAPNSSGHPSGDPSGDPSESAVQPGARGGCRVQLTMKFEFKSVLTGALFEHKFAETAASLVDAFVARARALPDG